MRYSGFFRCQCKKLHSTGDITPTTKCPGCDINLWDYIFNGKAN